MFARVIQAVGAGILMPLMQFTLFTLFSKEHRGFAMGLAGLVIQFAPAIGPTFTGLIIDNASWRVPFIVIVGIALVTFIFGLYRFQVITQRKKQNWIKIRYILYIRFWINALCFQ